MGGGWGGEGIGHGGAAWHTRGCVPNVGLHRAVWGCGAAWPSPTTYPPPCWPHCPAQYFNIFALLKELALPEWPLTPYTNSGFWSPKVRLGGEGEGAR